MLEKSCVSTSQVDFPVLLSRYELICPPNPFNLEIVDYEEPIRTNKPLVNSLDLIKENLVGTVKKSHEGHKPESLPGVAGDKVDCFCYC